MKYKAGKIAVFGAVVQGRNVIVHDYLTIVLLHNMLIEPSYVNVVGRQQQ